MPHTLTTCTFCGVGCGLYLETAGGKIVGSHPSLSHPANEGRICARGWHVHEVSSSPDRLVGARLRNDGELVPAGYLAAISHVARRLAEIREQHGPDSIAFACSPRCSNEEAYLLQKLARAVIGTNNVDHGAGVYRNNATEVLLDTLGVPATTGALRDLAKSEAILVDGLDLGRQLPTVAGRVIRAHMAGAKLIVVSDRRHRVAEHADVFLQPRPGTEQLLYGAIAKVIVDRGLVDRAFVATRCAGYDAFLESVRHHDLLAAARACGVPAADVEAAAIAYGEARAAALLFSTADETRSRETLEALVDLALLTGNVGREGSGVFALTEHNNLQGTCDLGMTPDRLPGYRPVADRAARAQLEQAWGVPLPEAPGLGAAAVLEHRGHGRVRAVWLCRYDPISTAPVGDAAASLDACELVVVQHIFPTATAKHAHAVLATTAFGEEEVTFTSNERAIQLARQAVSPPPGIVPSWRQITDVARALGARWGYQSAADVMSEIAEVVPFYSGATYDNLDRSGRQWPCTRDRPLGTPRLLTGNGERLRLAPLAPPSGQEPEDGHPLTLVFGHSNYYWNQNVLIQHSEVLKREYRALLLDYPDGFVELNPEDASALNVRNGDWVRLHAATGSVVTAARVAPEVCRGAVFVPFFVGSVQRAIRGAGDSPPTLVPVRIEREVP